MSNNKGLPNGFSEIIRAQVGSGAHGLAIAGTDGRDEMGICIEPPEYIIGLSQFQQYQYRTQPEGVRSGPGDLDLTIYSLRKYMKLALQGNPTVLMLLFVPFQEIVTINSIGLELRDHNDFIVSRKAGHRFLGYLQGQRGKLVTSTVNNTHRPELIEKYGFDTKFASHMVRLGIQGVELLETGKITLPIPEPWLTWLRDLKQGKRTEEEALDVTRQLEEELIKLIDHSSLPETPHYAWADQWLISAYQRMWQWRYSKGIM